ncbi:MAG: hypothetical protein ACEPOV_10310 [Hyphomicrobiales bacterium]
MTTLKGAMRSYDAAVKRAERESKRRAKEAVRRYKELEKLREIENAKQAVYDWMNYINSIQSIHKNCSEDINWKAIIKYPKPTSPDRKAINQDIATTKLKSFKPSFLNKLFNNTDKKIAKLKREIEEAKIKDDKIFQSEQRHYSEELNDWEILNRLAVGVNEKNPAVYNDILDYFDPFSDISELGTSISFDFESNPIDISFKVNETKIIPDYELKQTSAGKLSKKKMAKGKFYEIYQDHVCSSLIRIAREAFAHLPIDLVRINAVSNILNGATGFVEEQAILSVIIPKETICKLNLNLIDPSDSMMNFVHNMKFNKTKGFSVVSKATIGNDLKIQTN